MIYRALNTQRFLSMPETGMGYQIIEAKASGQYDLKKYVIYNGQLIVDLDNNFDEFKHQIGVGGFSRILNESMPLGFDLTSISLADDIFLYEKRNESANGAEIFVRLSAYENDMRIDFLRKRLMDGSYTTTIDDYIDCVSSGGNPIDRYAIPNDDEIKWAFYFIPKYGDALRRGKVQPNFGRNGGGIEVYFHYGTSDNTYQGKREYGK